MFTGIVEELGRVVAVQELPGQAARLTVQGPLVTSDAAPGDSIAVDGVCLTVVGLSAAGAGSGRDGFTADVMRETLQRSTLGGLRPGDAVNLERAVTPATRLGGHLVQGHVDGVGEVLERTVAEHWELVRFRLPDRLRRYLVAQGSITVDGVSLTVAGLGADEQGHWFSVSLIPTTLRATTLGGRRPGDRVNLEVDVLAKHVEALLAWRTP
jgi:riboflavin synthase